MLSEVRTGSVLASDGSVNVARAGRFGEMITGDSYGKYFHAAKDGRLFCASMQAGAVLGTALTATAVTVTLYNPMGSGVYLSVLQTAVGQTQTQTTTATGQSVLYAVNIDPAAALPATTTALTVRNALLGSGGAGRGVAFSAATLPAVPVAIRVHPFGTAQIATTAAVLAGTAITDYVDGAIVLSENTCLTLQGLATTTQITGIISILWAEIPS